MNEFAARVCAESTSDPRFPVTLTGRTAGAWVEFDASVPESGFSFWARPESDSYVVVDACEPGDGSEPTSDYLDAWLASDLETLPFDL